MVEWTDPQSAARDYRRRRSNRVSGLTGIGRALKTALVLLAGKHGRQVIDVSGDGPENLDPALLAAARATASAQAIEINGLVLINAETPDLDRYDYASVVNGFVVRVERREDFFSALKQKLFYEVAGRAPEPAVAWQQP
jgi:Protein of unknown function (DUF1194)